MSETVIKQSSEFSVQIFSTEMYSNIYSKLEKDPDSTFVDSLMELHQNTENHELQCILNYLFHWRLEDPLESVAEEFFSCPPSYMYYVREAVERFRSFEADPKIASQGFLEKKLLEQFNKQS